MSFCDIEYTWNELASILLVSRWTVRQRVEELGIKETTGYSTISDDNLDQIILEFRERHGSHVGRSMLQGHLKSVGLKIQQQRIKSALARVDPCGVVPEQDGLCATNNRKETVLELFRKATSAYGVPLRVRTDKGCENVLLWQEMESVHGPNRGSYLASSSTKNQ
eukprot:gene4098-4654_t